MAEFDFQVDLIREAVGAVDEHGIGLLDPVLHQQIRKMAITNARQNPEFLRLYREFYEGEYGPITTEV